VLSPFNPRITFPFGLSSFARGRYRRASRPVPALRNYLKNALTVRKDYVFDCGRMSLENEGYVPTSSRSHNMIEMLTWVRHVP